MAKFAIAVIIASVLIVGGIVWVTTKASQTGPLQGEEFESQGGQHIAVGEEHIPYNSNPPTSGPHYVEPHPAGIFDNELVQENVVHSLEHGGIWITYKPDLPQDQIDQLKNIVRRNRAQVLLSPRAANDSLIALASWTRLLKLEQIDEDKIVSFIRANRDHAPETIPL